MLKEKDDQVSNQVLRAIKQKWHFEVGDLSNNHNLKILNAPIKVKTRRKIRDKFGEKWMFLWKQCLVYKSTWRKSKETSHFPTEVSPTVVTTDGRKSE